MLNNPLPTVATTSSPNSEAPMKTNIKAKETVPSFDIILAPNTVDIEEAALFAPTLKASTKLNIEIMKTSIN